MCTRTENIFHLYLDSVVIAIKPTSVQKQLIEYAGGCHVCKHIVSRV